MPDYAESRLLQARKLMTSPRAIKKPAKKAAPPILTLEGRQQLTYQKFGALVDEAIAVLLNIMHDDTTPPRVRLDCAREVFDRALGKVQQQVDVTSAGQRVDSVQPLVNLSESDLETLAALLEKTEQPPTILENVEVVDDHPISE